MIFTPCPIAGAFVIDPEPIADNRGFFARIFCAREFAEHGLHTEWVQASLSSNSKRGTLRGLHYQADPHPEIKLVTCTAGAAFDVLVDLRPTSPTHGAWYAVELTATNRRSVYIPQGLAHGFQTLADNTVLQYQISEFFHPELSRGILWNDPNLQIAWPPCENRIISPRDQALPLTEPF